MPKSTRVAFNFHHLFPICSSILVASSACSPMSALLPFHLAETSEVLKKKQVSITGAVGGGGAALDGDGGGGGVRVRVGVGAKEEIGIEGTALRVNTGDRKPDSDPWIGDSTALGLKLSWKLAPVQWFAIIAGTGVTNSVTGTAVGGDLGVVFSSPRALHGWLRPYGGLRGTFAVPVGRPIDEAGGTTAGLAIPFGLSFESTPWLRFYVEGGALLAWSHGYAEPPSVTDRSVETTDHFGGYGAIGVAFILGPRAH